MHYLIANFILNFSAFVVALYCLLLRGSDLEAKVSFQFYLKYSACALLSGAIYMLAMVPFCCAKRIHQTHVQVHNRTSGLVHFVSRGHA